MDLQFLPWEPPSDICPDCGAAYEGWSTYKPVVIQQEFRSHAAAFMNWWGCEICEAEALNLEIGIGSACVPNRDLLCDRLHEAEEIACIRLSRGFQPWYADIHFDVYDVHYTGLEWGEGLELPWLHYHYFGPFDWPPQGRMKRLSCFADTVIPYLCEHALMITEYAWPLRKPHGGS